MPGIIPQTLSQRTIRLQRLIRMNLLSWATTQFAAHWGETGTRRQCATRGSAQCCPATSSHSALNLLPSALQIFWITSFPENAAIGTPKPLTH